MKLLVIALAGIGDTLLATPLIHELRVSFPKAEIDALVLWAGAKDLLEANPHVSRVYQWNFLKESRVKSLSFLRVLRAERYDLSINAHPQSRLHYRFVARVIGAPTRISHEYECSGWIDRWLVNRTLRQDYGKHTVENNLELLQFLGAKPLLPKHELEVYLTDAEREWARSFVAENGLEGRKLLGMHVGSGGTKNLKLKRWPFDHYLKLVELLRKKRPDLTVVLFGGGEEEADIQRLLAVALAPFAVRAATRNLRQAAALMRECAGFLSVDTALMHLAAAMKIPVQLVIEAPTLNETNLPYANQFTLIRNPAVNGRNLEYYRYDGRGIKGTPEELVKCMASVTVDEVFTVLSARLPSAVG